MAKPGLYLNNCKNAVRNTSGDAGWTLCIGAGISRGVFPDWQTLAQRLLGLKPGDRDFLELNKVLGLEALIQAAFHETGLKPTGFARYLSGKLYVDLQKMAGKDWEKIRKLLMSSNPGGHPVEGHQMLLDFFKGYAEPCTALDLASVLAVSIEKEFPPQAIISLNAEPLFQALTNAYLVVNGGSNKKMLDTVLRGMSNHKRDRIHCYYCHGLLPPPGAKISSHRTSVEKLVFSEAEYLGLAGSMFSWQSATFLHAAMNWVMVFIGLSFADPNLRRWLGFVHQDRLKEIKLTNKQSKKYSSGKDSTRHYWINKIPASKRQQTCIEQSVAHLGVRLIWIDSWSQAGKALQTLLGV